MGRVGELAEFLDQDLKHVHVAPKCILLVKMKLRFESNLEVVDHDGKDELEVLFEKSPHLFQRVLVNPENLLDHDLLRVELGQQLFQYRPELRQNLLEGMFLVGFQRLFGVPQNRGDSSQTFFDLLGGLSC